MESILKLFLNSDPNGVKLAATEFVKINDQDGLKKVKGQLIVSGEADFLRLEPSEMEPENVRTFGSPQQALLILILRAYSSGFNKVKITSHELPELARSIFEIYRYQTRKTQKMAASRWLYSLVGLRPEESLRDWFTATGSASNGHYCRFGLTGKWKDVALQVRINRSPIVVPVYQYEKLADAIESGEPFPEPRATASIDKCELLVWSGAAGCFLHGCDKVHYGDRVQLQLKVNQPACLYIVWLDSYGKIVTLYPWTGPNWERGDKISPVDRLTLPDLKEASDGQTLRVEGKAGVEHIVVLAKREPMGPLETRKLRTMIEDLRRYRGCPKPEVMVKTPFDGESAQGKPMRSVQRLVASNSVREFQGQLAATLRLHFDQVLICTFTNEGK